MLFHKLNYFRNALHDLALNLILKSIFSIMESSILNESFSICANLSLVNEFIRNYNLPSDVINQIISTGRALLHFIHYLTKPTSIEACMKGFRLHTLHHLCCVLIYTVCSSPLSFTLLFVGFIESYFSDIPICYSKHIVSLHKLNCWNLD